MSKIDAKVSEISDQLRKELGEIELRSMEYTVADAIREGSKSTRQARGSFGDGDSACALSAAMLAARARGFI